MTDLPAVDWFVVPGASMAHGFPRESWMRSLCGELRWTALLELAPARRRCQDCAFLAGGIQVAQIEVRRPVDSKARRRAIARSQARRRWRRTT